MKRPGPCAVTAALNEEPSGPGMRSNGNAGTIVAGMARAEMRERLNADLALDPARTAVLAIDTHRGHLDPEVATMPVAADIAADVMANSVRLLTGVRAAGVPTAFLVMHNRIIGGESEYLRTPWWRAVESARQSL